MRVSLGFVALLAACAADKADGSFVTASWSVRSVSANTPLDCPEPFTKAVLNVTAPAGAMCADGKQQCQTAFTCNDRMGTSDSLIPGVYEASIDIMNDDLTSTYAKSIPGTIDLTLGDKTFARQILTDGGVFKVAWKLKGTDSQPRTCEQAGAYGVAISATNEADPASSNSDEVDCENGIGYSFGYAVGSYEVSLEAVNEFGQTLGLADTVTGKAIAAPNIVTDLGTIDIHLN